MNDEQRKEIRQQFWDEDYFDGLPNRGELLKHFINEYGKAIERQQQAEIEALKAHPVKELTLTDDEVEEFEWVIKKHFNFPTSEKVPNLDRIIRAIQRPKRNERED